MIRPTLHRQSRQRVSERPRSIRSPAAPAAGTPRERISFSLLAIIGAISALTPFAIDIYLPSIPAIAADLAVPVGLVQLTVTVYLGVFAVAHLLLGPLSDVFGRRATILSGAALFLVADIGCILAPGLGWLLVARAVQALGGAAVAVTIPALVRDLFTRDDYARVMGLVILVMAAAPLIAPSVGSAILIHAGWRWIFVALGLIAIASAGAFAVRVAETLPVAHHHAFGIGRILGNYRGILRERAALGYLLTAAFSFAGTMVFVTASSFVYISLHGVSPTWFGVLFGVNIAAAMTVNGINSRVVNRHGLDRMLRLGITIQGGTASVLLALGVWVLLPAGGPPLWGVVVAAFGYIGAMGLVVGNAMAGFMSEFPRLAGTASAFAGALRFGLGALIGSLVSLAQTHSAAPLLLGMAGCGLGALWVYRALCCRWSPA